MTLTNKGRFIKLVFILSALCFSALVQAQVSDKKYSFNATLSPFNFPLPLGYGVNGYYKASKSGLLVLM